MNCVQCGNQLPDQGKFCNHCGAPIKEQAAVNWNAGPDEIAAAVQAELLKKSRDEIHELHEDKGQVQDEVLPGIADQQSWTSLPSDHVASRSLEAEADGSAELNRTIGSEEKTDVISLLQAHGAAQSREAEDASLNTQEAGVAPAPVLSPAESTEQGAAAAGRPTATRNGKPLWTWLVPAALAVLVVLALGGDYFYQRHIDRQVNGWIQEGEQLALDGQFEQGQDLIERALAKRPTHPVLLNDRIILQEVLKLKNRLALADQEAKAQQYDKANSQVTELQKTLKSRQGPIYEVLGKQASQKEEDIAVLQVKEGIASKKELAEITPYMALLKPYKGTEAAKTREKVKQKIADLAYTKASGELEQKKYERAIQTVSEALQFDSENAKLQGLQTTIEDKKAAFEKAEQQRIQKASEIAAKEDLKNRTDGVQLVDVSSGIDQDGNFSVTGRIKNTATRPISNVTIYLDILDSSGKAIYADTIYATPNDLAPGNIGNFATSYYDDGYMTSVSVTRLEWELE